MTCVGYGEIRGWTETERLFLIGIAFASFFVTSVIRSHVLNLLQQNKFKDIVKETKWKVKIFIHDVDRTIPERKISSVYYESIVDYVQ